MDTAWKKEKILLKFFCQLSEQVLVEDDSCPVGAVMIGENIDGDFTIFDFFYKVWMVFAEE